MTKSAASIPFSSENRPPDMMAQCCFMTTSAPSALSAVVYRRIWRVVKSFLPAQAFPTQARCTCGSMRLLPRPSAERRRSQHSRRYEQDRQLLHKHSPRVPHGISLTPRVSVRGRGRPQAPLHPALRSRSHSDRQGGCRRPCSQPPIRASIRRRPSRRSRTAHRFFQ